MPQEATQALAAFAASLDLDAVPERVRQTAKGTLLDALACALAGHQGEETPQIAAFAGTLAQSQESSVIGGGRSSLTGATLLNGFLVTAVTMCDTHRATLTHVMPEVLPPALAIAERDALSGRELLAAIIAGCEITTRIGIGLDYPVFRKKGWHGPGIIGPFGAAAAVGRLLHFDADTMARAFGLAGSQAAGTFAAWGTPTVKFHQCRGALSGLMAALLAQQKFVATREFLTAPDGGLYNIYTDGGRIDLALGELGSRWEMEQLSLRPWPAATHIQGAVTAMFDLVEQHRIDPKAIRQVRLAVSKVPFDMHGGFGTYKGKFEALLSAHYAVAAILHDRALTLAQFEPARYDDPLLRRFAAEKVVVRLDPELVGSQTLADIELNDGRVLAMRCMHPRGVPERRLTRAQIEEKFRIYAPIRLAEAKLAPIIDAVYGLENLTSARTLTDLLRA
ncbi:MAG: MmgE/PrpD family protein [Burkholderiales bacterium]